ncbi:hypothetical protein CALCODRAFT_504671 [Calocera cornea HHB12733]|uniref:Protein kinase domain-containing protein n=1 Tax=Calocera cornea HHB12733 TaxID=1353952 RepID=A0A165CA70_9BASI|nr:hypothetical protein CALCODRAFT_504671 [Calocera cornea HHB12733]
MVDLARPLPEKLQPRWRTNWERMKKSLRNDAARLSNLLASHSGVASCVVPAAPREQTNFSKPKDVSNDTLSRRPSPGWPTHRAIRRTRSVPRLLSMTTFETFFGEGVLNLPEGAAPDYIVPGHPFELVSNAGQKKIYRIDNRYALIITPPDTDIERIVRNQSLAAKVISAPWVYYFGRTVDCAYMLTDFIPGRNLQYYVDKQPGLDLSRLLPQIQTIVAQLASVNLAHNDLYPRNVMVDRHLNIRAIIDWDTSDTLDKSPEYQRRVVNYLEPHDWDSAFRPFQSSILFHGYEFDACEFGRTLPHRLPVYA